MAIYTYHPVDNIAFYLFVIAILEAQAMYTWQFRKLPGAKVAAVSQVCKGVWILSMVLFSTSTDIADKIFWITVQKMIAVLLSCLWIVFTEQISQQEKLVPPVGKYCIFGGVAFFSLLVASNWHGLIWQSAWLDGQAVVFVAGTGYVFIMGYGFLLGIIATILAGRWIVTSGGLRRRQALWYSLAALVSWVCFIMWKGSGQQNNEAIPWGFLLNGAIVTWIYCRLHLYDILPLAQAVALQNVVEGLLFVDNEDYIVDINATAQTMLKDLPVVMGANFKVVAAAWPALAEVDTQASSPMIVVEREQPEGLRFYQITKIPLQTFGEHSLGRIILLKDLTDEKRIQAQIIEQQKSVAIMAERASFARELHDNLCQVLGYINIQAQSIMQFEANGQKDAAISGLHRLSDVAKRAYSDVREYIRDVQLTKMMKKGLVEGVKEYIEQVRQYGLNIETDISEEFEWDALDGPVAFELLRIVQEAITNIYKHAEASHIRLELVTDTAVLRITVTDNGNGFDSAAYFAPQGFGLKIMHERVAKIGGKLEISSNLGRGSQVVVEIPRVKK